MLSAYIKFPLLKMSRIDSLPIRLFISQAKSYGYDDEDEDDDDSDDGSDDDDEFQSPIDEVDAFVFFVDAIRGTSIL